MIAVARIKTWHHYLEKVQCTGTFPMTVEGGDADVSDGLIYSPSI
jgi:hypothetical protein